MSHRLERTWVGVLDSPTWRRLGRSGVGSRALRSRPFRVADTSRRFAETALRCLGDPAAFSSVRTFCLFLGTVKSGGSLLGSLLDAHPRAVLADEADPLRYVAAGFRRDQVFHILAKTSRREAMKGRVTARRLAPYSLAVPGQWQGRFVEPVVIGDSRAGPTTRRLGDQPELLDRLHRLLGDVEDRYVHVVRNPYDPISAMVLRGRRTLPAAIEDYAGQCRRLATLRHRLGDKLLTVRYEDLLADPASELARLCRFLRVDPEAGYLAACAGTVDPSRRGERHQVAWTTGAVDAVGRVVGRFPFLEGYAFDGESRWTA